MVEVTNNAANLLLTSIQASSLEDDQCLRLVHQPEVGYALAVDSAQKDDEVHDTEGRTVLLVAPDVAEKLEEAVIDVEQGPEGPRLTIQQQ
jgi:Fe-S cluster assembly iron-binding protein IscA